MKAESHGDACPNECHVDQLPKLEGIVSGMPDGSWNAERENQSTILPKEDPSAHPVSSGTK